MNFAKAYEVLELWISSLNEKSPEKAAELYADHSVLLPTFSPRTLRTAEERHSYFSILAQRQNLRVSLHKNTFAESNHKGTSIAEGIYFFEFDVDGESLRFEARFSMVLDLSSFRPILQHHSSQLPRGLV
jgi:hypothetical protein